AFVDDRRLDYVLQPLGVGVRDARPVAEELVEPRELRDADRAEDVGEAVVEPRLHDVEVAARLDPVVAHAPDRVRQLAVVRRDGSALAGRDDLSRVERETRERAERAARSRATLRGERAG